VNSSKHTPAARRAQHPDSSCHVGDVFRSPVLVRESIMRAFARRHDPHARYLQLVMLMSSRVVDEFWCAPQLRHFSTRNVACDNDARGLVLAGIGTWRLPVVRDDVIAGCLRPAAAIVPASDGRRWLHDLGPLDDVLAWLHDSERGR
jgi:hypothetical protein